MKTLFGLLLLITVAAAGMMSWYSQDFILIDGSKFSIMHLEFPADNIAVDKLLAEFAPGTKQVVLKQLNADYIFMAGCYSAIMVLCLIAIRHVTRINTLQKELKKKATGAGCKKLLLALALLQLLAWGLDVWENAEVESWLISGAAENEIALLRIRTFVKFGIGISGFLNAMFVLLLSANLPKQFIKLKLTVILPNQLKIRFQQTTSISTS